MDDKRALREALNEHKLGKTVTFNSSRNIESISLPSSSKILDSASPDLKRKAGSQDFRAVYNSLSTRL